MSRPAQRSEQLLEAIEEDDVVGISDVLISLEGERLSGADELNLALAHNYASENNYDGLEQLAGDIYSSNKGDSLSDNVKYFAGGFAGGKALEIGYTQYTDLWPASYIDDFAVFGAGATVASMALLESGLVFDDSNVREIDGDSIDVDGTRYFSPEVEEVREKLDQEYGIDTYGH